MFVFITSRGTTAAPGSGPLDAPDQATVIALKPAPVWVIGRKELARLLETDLRPARVVTQHLAHRELHLLSLVEDHRWPRRVKAKRRTVGCYVLTDLCLMSSRADRTNTANGTDRQTSPRPHETGSRSPKAPMIGLRRLTGEPSLSPACPVPGIRVCFSAVCCKGPGECEWLSATAGTAGGVAEATATMGDSTSTPSSSSVVVGAEVGAEPPATAASELGAGVSMLAPP